MQNRKKLAIVENISLFLVSMLLGRLLVRLITKSLPGSFKESIIAIAISIVIFILMFYRARLQVKVKEESIYQDSSIREVFLKVLKSYRVYLANMPEENWLDYCRKYRIQEGICYYIVHHTPSELISKDAHTVSYYYHAIIKHGGMLWAEFPKKCESRDEAVKVFEKRIQILKDYFKRYDELNNVKNTDYEQY